MADIKLNTGWPKRTEEKNQLNPMQENILKAVQRVHKEQVEEAMKAGASGEQVLKDAGVRFGVKQPEPEVSEEGKEQADPISIALTGTQPPELDEPQQAQVPQQKEWLGGLLKELPQDYRKRLENALLLQQLTGQVPPKKEDIQKNIFTLRKEFNADPIIKDTKQILQSGTRINTVWDEYMSLDPGKQKAQKKNALDQALVISFNKLLDPGSVVRESEFARTPQGLSLVNRFKGAIERMRKGGVGLTDEDRQELVAIVNQLMDGQQKATQGTIDFYGQEADRMGVDRRRILGIFGKQTSSGMGDDEAYRQYLKATGVQ